MAISNPYETQKLINTVVLPTICTVGIVGNIIAAFVLRKMKSPSSTILQVLSVVDTLLLLVLMVNHAVLAYMNQSRLRADCRLAAINVTRVLQTYQSFITVFVSIDRCIAMFNPLRYSSRRSMKIRYSVIAILGLFSIIIPSPMYFGQKIQERSVTRLSNDINSTTSPRMVYPMRLTEFGRTAFYQVYSTWVYRTLMRYLPSAILLFTSVVLIVKLWTSARRARQMQKSSPAQHQQSRKEWSITIMIVLLVVVFIGLYTPVTLFGELYHPTSLRNSTVWIISPLLIALNSFFNFFLYYLSGQLFRKTLHKMICCECRQPFQNQRRSTDGTTEYSLPVNHATFSKSSSNLSYVTSSRSGRPPCSRNVIPEENLHLLSIPALSVGKHSVTMNLVTQPENLR